MFSLSDEALRYYELKVVQGPRQMTAWAEHEDLEEGFSLNVLDSPSGARPIRSSVPAGNGFSRKSCIPQFF